MAFTITILRYSLIIQIIRLQCISEGHLALTTGWAILNGFLWELVVDLTVYSSFKRVPWGHDWFLCHLSKWFFLRADVLMPVVFYLNDLITWQNLCHNIALLLCRIHAECVNTESVAVPSVICITRPRQIYMTRHEIGLRGLQSTPSFLLNFEMMRCLTGCGSGPREHHCEIKSHFLRC